MMAHDWDEDAICTRCGFDGAEWMHWKHFSYEGKASDAKMPTCKYRPHLSPIYPFIPMKPIPAPGTT